MRYAPESTDGANAGVLYFRKSRGRLVRVLTFVFATQVSTMPAPSLSRSRLSSPGSRTVTSGPSLVSLPSRRWEVPRSNGRLAVSTRLPKLLPRMVVCPMLPRARRMALSTSVLSSTVSPFASTTKFHLRNLNLFLDRTGMGFNDQEIVALSGAHALGRCHPDRSGLVFQPFCILSLSLTYQLNRSQTDLTAPGTPLRPPSPTSTSPSCSTTSGRPRPCPTDMFSSRTPRTPS